MSTGEQEPTVRTAVMRGVAWKTVSAVSLQVSRMVTTIVLARLLLPSDYGLAAMVLVFSSLVFVFADVGLGAALVQRVNITDDDRNTVFWVTVAVGAALTLIGVGVSGLIADFYRRPQVGPLFAVFSISFLLTAVSSTHMALFTREMDFRSLELRQIISYVAGSVAGITAAAEGMGAWAIILQQLTISAVGTFLLTAFSRWRPSFRFSRASLRGLGGYGGNVFGSRLLFYFNRNADNILIGRFLGSAALGAYAIGYNAMLLPFSQLAGPLQEVLFPAFARVQADTAHVVRLWLRANRVVGAVTIPAFAGLAIVAPEFVSTLLGAKWHAATPVIQVLCVVGLLQSLQRMNSSILEARDRTSTLFRFSIVSFVTSITAFASGLHWGIVGVASAYAVANLLLQPYYAVITCRVVELPVLDFVRAIARVAQAGALMAAAVFGLRLVLVAAGVPTGARLALLIAAGAAVYVPAVLWRDAELRGEIRGLVASRRAKAPLPQIPALREG